MAKIFKIYQCHTKANSFNRDAARKHPETHRSLGSTLNLVAFSTDLGFGNSDKFISGFEPVTPSSIVAPMALKQRS